VTGAASGIREQVRAVCLTARHQPGEWHLLYSLQHVLTLEGVPLARPRALARELGSILRRAPDGARRLYQTFRREVRRYRSAATLLRQAAPYILYPDRSLESTTSIAEREMRELNRGCSASLSPRARTRMPNAQARTIPVTIFIANASQAVAPESAAGLELTITPRNGGASVLVTTDTTGKATLPLRAGRYRVRSLRAVSIGCVEYSWDVESMVTTRYGSLAISLDPGNVTRALVGSDSSAGVERPDINPSPTRAAQPRAPTTRAGRDSRRRCASRFSVVRLLRQSRTFWISLRCPRSSGRPASW